jgi:LPXTG-site transpeptidase (sortase) family protein
MEEKKVTIGLDNPVFAGRLRAFEPIEEVAPKPTPKVLKVTQSVSEVSLTSLAAPQPKVSEKPQQPAPSSIQFYFDDIENSKPKKISNTVKKARKHQFISNALIFLALLLLCFGVYVAASGMRINKIIQGSHANAQSSEDPAPDETKPTDEDINAYSVAPNMPRYIKVDSLGIKARVKQLGVNKKNQLQAPNNVFDAGWFKDSAIPGATAGGTSVIDGHVSGMTSRGGVFLQLKNISAGDTITIVRGDGKELHYKVIGKEAVDKDKVDMSQLIVSHAPGKAALNLITCTGKFDGKTYDQRLIVYTEFVQ